MTTETLKVTDVADRLRCSTTKVRREAKRLGIGANLQGRAGWRFTEADIDVMWEAMRPAKPVERRRKRRSA